MLKKSLHAPADDWFSRSIPASALNEDFDDEDDEISGEDRDDEKTITRYNVCHQLAVA